MKRGCDLLISASGLTGPGANELGQINLLRNTRFFLRRAKVKKRNHLFPFRQPQAFSHMRRISQLTGAPHRANALRIGSQ